MWGSSASGQRPAASGQLASADGNAAEKLAHHALLRKVSITVSEKWTTTHDEIANTLQDSTVLHLSEGMSSRVIGTQFGLFRVKATRVAHALCHSPQ
jgi:hypothetical protein